MRIDAPWDAYEVAAIKAWQHNGSLHPLTCEYHSDRPLEVRPEGLSCGMPTCSYVQTWAPAVCIGSPR